MKSLKLNLFEFRKTLNPDQSEVLNIISEHINLCNEEYSEKEIIGSLDKTLIGFTYLENVKTLLSELDNEINENALYFTLKDLYAKLARKDNRFLYDMALNMLLECINESNDEDRKIKIVENLSIYEWIPEIKLFLFEMASTPQEKMMISSKGGKIDDVYSVVLQVKEGYLARVHDSWFLLAENDISGALLETYVSNDIELKKLRLLEQALQIAEFKGNSINFDLGEGCVVSINTNTGKIYLDGTETEKETTLESLFNSPVIPFQGKGYYPIVAETLSNLKKFVVLDSVKKIYNIINSAYECYIFNHKGSIYQYSVDKFHGSNTKTWPNAQAIIENVMQDLGVDVTYFYENLLSEELKMKHDLEKQELKIQESLTNIESAILKIKDESIEDIKLMENVSVKKMYNELLVTRHKLCEEIKAVRNKKNKVIA
jgi:hypothetical protein